jgi:hypothetical protein
MDDQSILTTSRLLITPLAKSDENFIFELVNTEGWMEFIGNRNITSLVAAGAYIQNILVNKSSSYWVVKIKDSEEKNWNSNLH